MTSLTGSTALNPKLVATVAPPTFVEAISGAVLQISVVSYVWSTQTSLSACGAGLRACASDPWARQVAITLALALSFWFFSLRTLRATGTSDPSVVDRLWSILPALYCWGFVAQADRSSPGFPRLVLMTLLVSIWAVRLTWNFYIKGGFSGGEDYRWAVIRKWFLPGWQWETFNLLFICLFQQLVILAFTSPAAAAVQSLAPLAPLDFAAAFLFALLLVGETVADRQMFSYQTEKYRRLKAKEKAGEFAKGFIDTGLWAWSRHPNYFCEVSIWWAFYLFSVGATGEPVNWTLLGPIFLTMLFVLPRASLDTAEGLSSQKYPAYAAYQARVSRFLPWFPSAPTAAGKKEMR